MTAQADKLLSPRLRGDAAFLGHPDAGFANDGTEMDDLQALAALYQQGVRRLYLRCDLPRGRLPASWRRLQRALSRLNHLLASRGARDLTLTPVRQGTRLYTRTASEFDPPENPARRKLWQAAPPKAEELPPLAALQSRGASDPSALFAATPVIDAQRCSGCDACLRLCPEGALTLASDQDQTHAYRVSAAHCTACMLCREVCDASAIEIAENAPAGADVALRRTQCTACGVAFHQPRVQAADDLCPICRRSGHHKKLFQVLT